MRLEVEEKDSIYPRHIYMHSSFFFHFIFPSVTSFAFSIMYKYPSLIILYHSSSSYLQIYIEKFMTTGKKDRVFRAKAIRRYFAHSLYR